MRGATNDYWTKRIRSTAFKRSLTGALQTEIRALADARVQDVLDPTLIRGIIAEWDARIVSPATIAELVIQGNRRATTRLRRRVESLSDLIEERRLDDIDALLRQFAALPPNAEDLISGIMEQEFMRRLFTDLIFTAIVNFNQKLNPFFGAAAMRALEEQIKGFIRLFMPMLQQQAIAFATSRTNQRLVLDLTRAVIRRLLDEPLRHYLLKTTAAQRRHGDAFIRRAATDEKLVALIRSAAVAMWDDLYGAIKQKRLGEVLQLAENSRWLAERCVEFVLPVLARPAVRDWLASEASVAAPSTRSRT